MKISRTKKDLLIDLKNQIEFLESSAHSYEQGCDAEAVRMSVAIRILVHDSSQSKSLLAQLDIKDILFYDTASDYNPKNLISHIGLATMSVGGPGGGGYIALLDNVPPHRQKKKVPFDNWWNKIVISDKTRNQFARKSIVLNVANTDGGAHIDPSLDKKYAELSRFNSLAWKVVVGGIEKPFGDRPELACIRQITHEVLKTLKDEFPEYF